MVSQGREHEFDAPSPSLRGAGRRPALERLTAVRPCLSLSSLFVHNPRPSTACSPVRLGTAVQNNQNEYERREMYREQIVHPSLLPYHALQDTTDNRAF